ncbi:MAG: c-type cytochrome [Pirellulales bacterium]
MRRLDPLPSARRAETPARTVAAVALAAAALTAAIWPQAAQAQDTPDYFRQNCMNCHTIGGGRLTGPDLKDVTQQQTRDWLVNWLLNPKAVLDSGDPYAQKIFEESRRVPMPMGPGMTRERAENLLDLIEAESKLPESQFKGLQISTAPFTAADVQAGRDIFIGTQRLANGGTACISCHAIHDMTALGGGQLGPDLTNVYDRLLGRVSLSAWLVAPGTATMQPIFKNHPLTADEIHSLVAYFENAAPHRPADPTASRVTFLLLGLGGATALLFAFDGLWKWRFRGVRRPMVDAAQKRGA